MNDGPNINAGDLRHRVTLSRDPAPTTSTVGQHRPAYVAIGTYYARVVALSGAEVDNADQRKGILHYQVTLRASAGPVRPTDRLAWNGHILAVESAVTDPFGIGIVVEATEKVGPQ